MEKKSKNNTHETKESLVESGQDSTVTGKADNLNDQEPAKKKVMNFWDQMGFNPFQEGPYTPTQQLTIQEKMGINIENTETNQPEDTNEQQQHNDISNMKSTFWGGPIRIRRDD